jgi:hypothetical protein
MFFLQRGHTGVQKLECYAYLKNVNKPLFQKAHQLVLKNGLKQTSCQVRKFLVFDF